MEAVRHGILRAVSHSCVRITTSWLHVEADVKAEESKEAGPSLLPNLISEESRPGSLRIFDVKDPQLRERSGTFQLFELPSQTQQLATPNHNTHTHTHGRLCLCYHRPRYQLTTAPVVGCCLLSRPSGNCYQLSSQLITATVIT